MTQFQTQTFLLCPHQLVCNNNISLDWTRTWRQHDTWHNQEKKNTLTVGLKTCKEKKNQRPGFCQIRADHMGMEPSLLSQKKIPISLQACCAFFVFIVVSETLHKRRQNKLPPNKLCYLFHAWKDKLLLYIILCFQNTHFSVTSSSCSVSVSWILVSWVLFSILYDINSILDYRVHYKLWLKIEHTAAAAFVYWTKTRF